jgi:5,10-methylenetetrahydrofolate reductase
MSVITRLGQRLGARFPNFFKRADKVVAPVERAVKEPVFGCHMCGQCILHSTGMTCPMECPKNLRNGPCGGVGMDGSCEVDRSLTCVWFNAVNRSARLPWAHEIYQRNPPVDWSLQGTSSWVNVFTGQDHPQRVGLPWQRVTVPGRNDRPPRSGSTFEHKLREGRFVVTCEINPPDSADATAYLQKVRPLIGLVDAAHISDNSLASPHMCGLALAGLIEQMGMETILHMTCRDRNRLMLQADVLGATAFGVKNILCLGGDHTSIGDHPEAKPVFDLDSINFIALLRRMRDEGVFESGRKLEAPPRVFIGGGAEPTAPPLEFRPHRLGKKVAAGLDFAVTQLVFDMDLLRLFMQRVRDLGLDRKIFILVGVAALTGVSMARFINENTPGVVVPEHLIRRLAGVPKDKRRDEGLKILVEQIQELREMPGVSGIDMMEVEPAKYLEVIDAAGLYHREPAA